MKWFPVDSDNPNDPKVKALIQDHGPEGYGRWMLLCSYVAMGHGHSEPGLAVKADGTALPLKEIRTELHFKTVDDLHVFVQALADQDLIHAQLWADKQLIFLPGMWTRQVIYARSKGRTVSQFPSVTALADSWLADVIPAVPATARKVPKIPAKARLSPRRPAKARSAPERPLTYTSTDTTKNEERGAANDAARPEDPKAHPIKEILTFHDGLFLKATGERYPDYTAGDAKNVGQMLKHTSQADLQAEIAFMFECQDAFVQQCGYTIGAFLKLRPKLTVLRTAQPRAPAAGRTQVVPGKYADL